MEIALQWFSTNPLSMIKDGNYSWLEILMKIIIPITMTFLISGYIGLERQNVGKAAGLSAHILVGLASVGIAIMQRLIYEGQLEMILNGIAVHAESQRIIAQVVAGVGFIGAGVILKSSDNTIRGITTAGTIWAIAMVGIIIGTGYLVLGGILGLVMITFITLRDIRRGINPLRKTPEDREDHHNVF